MAKLAKGIYLRFLPRVKKDVRHELSRIVAHINNVYGKITHVIKITVVPHEVISCGKPGDRSHWAFGTFHHCKSRKVNPRMTIAAGFADLHEKDGLSRREGVEAVGETLLHEFAHYEQWRDRKPIIENGPTRRAKSLYRKIGLPH